MGGTDCTIQRQHMDKRVTEWTPREWTRRQGDLKQDGETALSATWVLAVAKNSQRPASVETVQGGVPPYGVKDTLVVNGKWWY